MAVDTSSWDEPGHKKTPEMSELEPDKISLKIWVKKKSSDFQNLIFRFWEKFDFPMKIKYKKISEKNHNQKSVFVQNVFLLLGMYL